MKYWLKSSLHTTALIVSAGAVLFFMLANAYGLVLVTIFIFIGLGLLEPERPQKEKQLTLEEA